MEDNNYNIPGVLYLDRPLGGDSLNLLYDTMSLHAFRLATFFSITEALKDVFWEEIPPEQVISSNKILLFNDVAAERAKQGRARELVNKPMEIEKKTNAIKLLKLFIVSNPYSHTGFCDIKYVDRNGKKTAILVSPSKDPDPFLDFSHRLLSINPNITFLRHHHKEACPEALKGLDVKWLHPTSTEEGLRDAVSLVMDVDIPEDHMKKQTLKSGRTTAEVNYVPQNKEDSDFEVWKKENKAFVDRQYGYFGIDKHKDDDSSKTPNQGDVFSNEKKPVIVGNTDNVVPDGKNDEADPFPDLPF